MTRAPAQAGNRASRTEHYLQWLENSSEWNAVNPAVRKRHDSSFWRATPGLALVARRVQRPRLAAQRVASTLRLRSRPCQRPSTEPGITGSSPVGVTRLASGKGAANMASQPLAPLAQWLERRSYEPPGAGSDPAGCSFALAALLLGAGRVVLRWGGAREDLGGSNPHAAIPAPGHTKKRAKN